MKSIMELADKIFTNNMVRSVLVIVIGLLVYKIISGLLLNKGRKLRVMNSGKGETYLRLTNSALKYAVLIVTFFLFLQVNDVNVSSLIAGLGIVGVVLGLTVQDALKDIIRGFTIISDGYFKVGDLVNYNGMEGKVLELGLKTTKLRDIKTGNVVSIPNRSIEEIQVVSDYLYLDVPLPYECKLQEAQKIMEDISRSVEQSTLVKRCEYRGVNGLEDSFIAYQLAVECADNQAKLQVRRSALHTALSVLEQHGISVPYPQIDVHHK